MKLLIPLHFVLLLLGAVSLSAKSPPVAHPALDWQCIRDQQPEGLTLTLELPKTRFHQGEVIDATLLFRNTSKEEYTVSKRSYDRSGRLADVAFLAVASDGTPVVDPLNFVLATGGIGGYEKLGEVRVSQVANQWLRFDQPGDYRLFAWTERVQPEKRVSGTLHFIELVSDPVTITIEPLDPALEQRIIAECQAVLQNPIGKVPTEKQKNEARTKWRFLGTPAACEALIPMLGTKNDYWARWGIHALADKQLLGEKLLRQVEQNNLIVDETIEPWIISLLVGTSKREGYSVRSSVCPMESDRVRSVP